MCVMKLPFYGLRREGKKKNYHKIFKIVINTFFLLKFKIVLEINEENERHYEVRNLYAFQFETLVRNENNKQSSEMMKSYVKVKTLFYDIP